MILEDVPVVSLGAAGRGPWTSAMPTRRGFLKGAAGVVTLIGMYTLGILRFSPRAFTAPPPYTTAPDCNHYGAGACDGKGGVGCVGSEDDNLYTDNSYCASCAETIKDCDQNWYQYFYNGTRDQTKLVDRDDNICERGKYDTWNHIPDPSNCGSCTTSIWRCHDGYKINSSGTHPAICHGLVACDSAFSPTCPQSC